MRPSILMRTLTLIFIVVTWSSEMASCFAETGPAADGSSVTDDTPRKAPSDRRGTSGSADPGGLVTTFGTAIGMMLVQLGLSHGVEAANACSSPTEDEKAMERAIKVCQRMEGQSAGVAPVALGPNTIAKRALDTALADVDRRRAPAGAMGTSPEDLVKLRATVAKVSNQERSVYFFYKRRTLCTEIAAKALEGMECIRSVYESRRAMFNDVCRFSPEYADADVCKAGFPKLE